MEAKKAVSRESSQHLGILGEEIGAQYLKDKGYVICAKRYTNSKGMRLGEIDLIALKAKELYFVEVKTRKTSTFTATLPPEAAISRQKLFKLQKIAQAYMREKNLMHMIFHFDALAIYYDESSATAQVKHFQDIFF